TAGMVAITLREVDAPSTNTTNRFSQRKRPEPSSAQNQDSDWKIETSAQRGIPSVTTSDQMKVSVPLLIMSMTKVHLPSAVQTAGRARFWRIRSTLPPSGVLQRRRLSPFLQTGMRAHALSLSVRPNMGLRLAL